MKLLKILLRYGAFMIIMLFSYCGEGQSQALHIMTYNIRHGCDIHEKLQLKEIAALIKKNKMDIVGLTEVDSVCKRSGKTDQPAILAKLTGMHVAYVRHFAFDGGSYGLALLSKFPITNVVNNRIPVLTAENGNTRALLSAQLMLPGDKRLKVVVAHLDYRSEVSRIRQSEIIIKMLKDQGMPVVLLGDLNANPDSKTLVNLKKHFTDANGSDNKTFPSDNPKAKIDYILVDKKHFHQSSGGMVYPVQYSDHRPISADVQLSF